MAAKDFDFGKWWTTMIGVATAIASTAVVVTAAWECMTAVERHFVIGALVLGAMSVPTLIYGILHTLRRDRRRWQEITEMEVHKAVQQAQGMAAGISGSDAVVAVLHCNPMFGHGLTVKQATFILQVFNVSPFVLKMERCTASLVGFDGNAIVTTDEDRKPYVTDVPPGAA